MIHPISIQQTKERKLLGSQCRRHQQSARPLCQLLRSKESPSWPQTGDQRESKHPEGRERRPTSATATRSYLIPNFSQHRCDTQLKGARSPTSSCRPVLITVAIWIAFWHCYCVFTHLFINYILINFYFMFFLLSCSLKLQERRVGRKGMLTPLVITAVDADSKFYCSASPHILKFCKNKV